MGRIDATVKEKLKASILIQDVAEDLGLLQSFDFDREGKQGNCFSKCNATSKGCKLNKKKNNYHCFHNGCDKSFDSIELVMLAKGLKFNDACKYLAETFRRDLLDELAKGEWLAPEEKQKYATSNLYEMVFEFGKTLLYKEQGIVAYKYLTEERGYDPSKLLQTEWIYWPKDGEIRDYLKKQLPIERHQEVYELKLNGIGGDEFRAALPYRDMYGNISGFAKRHTSKQGLKHPEDGKFYRWSYTAGLKKDDLYGICDCKHSKQDKQSKHLIIVEGLPDASYLPSVGIEDIVAIGQGELSEKHIHGLKVYEIESVTIAFDNDKPGKDGVIGSVERAKKASDLLERHGIRTFILSHEGLKDVKDVEEYLIKYGVDKLEDLLDTAACRALWLPYYFTYKGGLETDLGKHRALSGAAKEYTKLRESERPKFKKALSAFFKLTPEEFEDELEFALKKDSDEKAEVRRKQASEEAQKLLAEGKDEEAFKVLTSLKVENKESFFQIKPYTIDDLRSDLAKTKEGLKTGFKELDEVVRIPNEAITLVGGRPSHGKTTFMLNLFLNLIKQYPDRNFYFFSYEETIHQIAVKLINILSGHVFNEAKNLLELEGYLKSGATACPAVEKGKKQYQALVDSGRLRIVGHPFYVDDLATQIAYICNKETVGGVFIDYIQKIKNKGKFGTRQLELQKTSEIILETAKSCSIPIILGAQLGRSQDSKDKVKLDNLREAGDLEQDANLVLGIFNPGMEKAQESQSQLTERTVELRITPLKNRNGLVNKTVSLEFDRPILTVQDQDKVKECIKKNSSDRKDWDL